MSDGAGFSGLVVVLGFQFGQGDNDCRHKPEGLHDPYDDKGIRADGMKQKADQTGYKSDNESLIIRGYDLAGRLNGLLKYRNNQL